MSRKRWGEGKFGISPFSLTPILLSLFWHPLLIKLNEIHIFVTASAKATWKRLSKPTQAKKDKLKTRKGAITANDCWQQPLSQSETTLHWENLRSGQMFIVMQMKGYIFRNRLFYSKIYWLCRYYLKLWTFSLQCGKWEGRQNIE